MRTRLGIFLCGLAVILAAGVSRSQDDPLRGETAAFFSQGQAVYDPQNLAGTQQSAIKEMLGQAIVQALGAFMSPSEMGSQYEPLQEAILKHPDRYVQSYQIFSEAPADGLYRIVGQVTVSLDALKKDLPQNDPALSDTSFREDPRPVSESLEPSEPVAMVEASDTEMRSHSDPQKIFWAVAERWDGEWVLPQEGQTQGLFAMSALEKSREYGWSLQFPEYGSLAADEKGDIPLDKARSLAVASGIEKMAVGYVTFRLGEDQMPLMEVVLRVVNASSGQSEGEIHKKLTVEEPSYQESAVMLAGAVIPQLDGFLAGKPQPVAGAVPLESAGHTGEWTLLIRSASPYVYWEEMEDILRGHYESMHVKSLELKAEGISVRIQGVGADFLTLLQGIQLRDGLQVQVGGYSPEAHSLEVTFAAF